jgi:acyl-CoA thioester hydrolase
MNVVHHTHYLVWFEIGRTELMRTLGCDYASVEDAEGIQFPLRRVGVRYRAPARYDDVVDVRTRLVATGGASVRFEYRVIHGVDGRLLATGFTEHAATGKDGRPCRLPAELRGRLVAGTTRP